MKGWKATSFKEYVKTVVMILSSLKHRSVEKGLDAGEQNWKQEANIKGSTGCNLSQNYLSVGRRGGG